MVSGKKCMFGLIAMGSVAQSQKELNVAGRLQFLKEILNQRFETIWLISVLFPIYHLPFLQT